MHIAIRYALRYDTIEQASAAMALDLMRDDPRMFKSGYSLENALLAVKEAFGFHTAEWIICEPTIRDFINNTQELPAPSGVGWPE